MHSERTHLILEPNGLQTNWEAGARKENEYIATVGYYWLRNLS